MSGWVDAFILPRPMDVLISGVELSSQGTLLIDLAASARRVTCAVVIAMVVGVPAGLYLGYRRDIYAYLAGPVHAMRSVPATALIPLFILVIGVGELSIISVATYPSSLVLLVNTVNGAALANAHRVHQGRLLELGPGRMIAGRITIRGSAKYTQWRTHSRFLCLGARYWN